MRVIPERAIALFTLAGAAAGAALLTDATASMALIWASGGVLCAGLRVVESALTRRNYDPAYDTGEEIVARPRRMHPVLAPEN